VSIAVANRVRETRPGVATKDLTVCIVRFDAPFVDQLVCPLAEVDSVMGPMPSAQRARTGLSSFDKAYAAFLQTSQDGSAYRAVEDPSAVLGGLPHAILEHLQKLDLQWARVHEGKCALAFAPLEAVDVVRAARVAARIARGHDEPSRTIDGGRKSAPRADFRSLDGAAIAAAWVVSFIAAIPLVAVLAPAWSVLKEPGARTFCDGGSFTYTSSSHKYIECANNPSHSLFLYHFACFVIIVASCASLILAVAKLRAVLTSSSDTLG
jgi:hypothetical protein